ncbi:hypothetical protein HYX12_00785 [Candidatus Woesearchaeota archaeon]|nr:hypothetical protein [Candidatus Woesearchaeota archaeon]
MCTIGVTRINGKILMFKNRDKLFKEEEEIEKTKSCIFIKSKVSGKIVAGLNKQGVAFVRAEILSEDVIKAIYANDPLFLNLYVNKNNRTTYATKLNSSNNFGYAAEVNVAEKIAHIFNDVSTAAAALKFIQNTGFFFEPSIVLLADKDKIFSLEIEKNNLDIKEFCDNVCRTNHFSVLKFGPKVYTEYPSSFERLASAESMISRVRSIEQLKESLSNHDDKNPDFNICRHFISSTISSCIIDVNDKSLWHCNDSPCKVGYQLFQLDNANNKGDRNE